MTNSFNPIAPQATLGDQLKRKGRSRREGLKKRSRTRPTWFSTWPFSQPHAGVQATGSTR
jgi:hypothetical protein